MLVGIKVLVLSAAWLLTLVLMATDKLSWQVGVVLSFTIVGSAL